MSGELLDPEFLEFVISESSSSLDSPDFSLDEVNQYCINNAISEIEQKILPYAFEPEDSEKEHQEAVDAGAEFLSGPVKTCATHATNLPQGRIEFGTVPTRRKTWMAAVVIPVDGEKSDHPWFFITDLGLRGRYRKHPKIPASRVVLNETLASLYHAFGLSSSGFEVTEEGLNLVAALDSKAKKLAPLDTYIWFNMYQCILQWVRTGVWNDKFFKGACYQMPATLEWFRW
jgi:hypothetical protein